MSWHALCDNDFGVSGGNRVYCLRCGACCRWPGYVHLTEDDITRLSRALGLSERDFIERHTRLTRTRAGLSLTEKADGSCIFLEGSLCAVYEARPTQCRSFGESWGLDDCPARTMVRDGHDPVTQTAGYPKGNGLVKCGGLNNA